MKPTIYYEPAGESGNIFSIVSQSAKAMKKSKCPDADIKQMQTEVYKSHSYDDALEIINKYCELIEVVK